MNQLSKIVYISNAGVLLEFGDKKVLVDGFCSSNIPMYKTLPAEIKEQMITGIPPFNNINLLLFTHDHPDHFDPESTVDFLIHHKNAVIIANHDVIWEIRHLLSDLADERWIKPPAAFGSKEKIRVNGINIESFSMLHDGKEYGDVKNMAYLIEAGEKRILHVGDAKPARENYANLNLIEKNIDLLIAPFPYVGLSSGRQVIEKYIKPKKIAAIHLPYRELDSNGWIDAAKKSYMKVKKDFIETIFLEDIGNSIII